MPYHISYRFTLMGLSGGVYNSGGGELGQNYINHTESCLFLILSIIISSQIQRRSENYKKKI